MQSLVFLTCVFQTLSKKNVWGSARHPPFGKGRVKIATDSMQQGRWERQKFFVISWRISAFKGGGVHENRLTDHKRESFKNFYSDSFYNIIMDLPIFVIAEWATLLVDIRCSRGGS